MIHRLRPRTASTFCSGFEVFVAVTASGTEDFCSGPKFSSSWETTETGRPNGFLLKVGIMLWNVAEGSGGLGVLVRVPGLVRPSSLVRSAIVPLLLLHVEAHDRPREGSLLGCSSTGELVWEFNLSAVVRRDSLRSKTGFDFAKDVVDECWRVRRAGRGVVRPNSGGSSASATISSSEAMAGGDVLGRLRVVSMMVVVCRPG